MLFTHDTEVALQDAAALVNTLDVVSGEDTLQTPEDLHDFVVTWGWTGTFRRDRTELEEVRALRPRFRELWQLDEEELVRRVNEMLAQSGAQPRLVRHDHWGWHLHATPDDAPLAVRMTVEFAMALVDLIRSEELGRLGVCRADDCQDVLVDLTRNRSRRFCSTTCGNRMAAAAYRERQSAT